jgi:hypothetical protein
MSAGLISRQRKIVLRFSVRGLLAVVLVISLYLGWFARSTRVQREAVLAITKAGGSVKYDWELRNGDDIPGRRPWAPSWLVNLVGVDCSGHVINAALPIATSASVAQIGRLTQLESLNLHFGSSPASDDDFIHLERLTKLSTLVLSTNDVPDGWLMHLRASSNLSISASMELRWATRAWLS